MSKTYAIVEDIHYGWKTGLSGHGEQVLAADSISVIFDSDGKLIRFQDEDPANWEERADRLIASKSTIRVLPFEIPGMNIGLRPRIIQSDDGPFYVIEFLFSDNFWLFENGIVSDH